MRDLTARYWLPSLAGWFSLPRLRLARSDRLREVVMRGDVQTQRLARRLELLGAVALALGIFALDVLSPLQGAVAVLYTTAVLLTARTLQRDLTIGAGIACAGLAALGYAISHASEPLGSPALRLTVSLVAIGITTLLAVRNLAESDWRRRTQMRLDQAQAELAHVTRVNLLGQLASSIAHEVNQPLSAIVTYATSGKRWLAREAPEAAEVADCLEHVASNALRAADVIARVRDLARPVEARQERFAMAPLIDETIALLRRDLQSHDVIIRIAVEPDLPAIEGDRVQIQQVLMNLMLNADQAMAATPSDRRELLVEAFREGDDLMVAVHDRGPGIATDPESLFSPFITTKADGMGMGLSISRTIVERHDGKLNSANRAEGGATFRFNLPVKRKVLAA